MIDVATEGDSRRHSRRHVVRSGNFREIPSDRRVSMKREIIIISDEATAKPAVIRSTLAAVRRNNTATDHILARLRRASGRRPRADRRWYAVRGNRGGRKRR